MAATPHSVCARCLGMGAPRTPGWSWLVVAVVAAVVMVVGMVLVAGPVVVAAQPRPQRGQAVVVGAVDIAQAGTAQERMVAAAGILVTAVVVVATLVAVAAAVVAAAVASIASVANRAGKFPA